MSPSEPPIRISEPRASRYAFDTHCCEGSPPPRSRSIAGRATLTIDPSIAATPEPRIAATSVSRWLRLMAARAASGSDEALDEGERGVGDLTPAAVDGERVPAARDRDELGDRLVPLLPVVGSLRGRRLEDWRAGARHRVRLVQLLRLFLADGVGEAVAELLVGERDRAVAVRGVLEDR